MDPYRELFLRQVRQIVTATSQPGPESLHQLLKTVSPEITLEEAVHNVGTRNKAFQELKLRIQRGSNATTAAGQSSQSDTSITALIHHVDNFFDACCCQLALVKPSTVNSNTSNSNVVVVQKQLQQQQISTMTMTMTTTTTVVPKKSAFSSPSEFKVTDKWPHVSLHHPITPATQTFHGTSSTLDILMAYKCINARGCIAYGAKPGLFFGWSKVEQDAVRFGGTPNNLSETIEHFFREKFKGAKRLEGVEAIKQELITRGPVLSVSFTLSASFANSPEHKDSYCAERINQNHPVILVGWNLTSFGEVWLVRSFDDNVTTPIAFGQFKIDELCMAPMSDLDNVSWQGGPFVDVDMSQWPKDWRNWTTPEFFLSSSELERLSECLEGGFLVTPLSSPASTNPESRRFVIRDAARRAHSRTWYLQDIQFVSSTKQWKVRATVPA
jgi:hypothetical protein